MVETIKPTLGLRHVALLVADLQSCIRFYVNMLGMHIEWQPDDENVYLSSGHDNLALHQAKQAFSDKSHQRLDHIGFIVETPSQVDVWYHFFKDNHVAILAEPKTHRDGARSFYCQDPDGNCIQMIYHPPLAEGHYHAKAS